VTNNLNKDKIVLEELSVEILIKKIKKMITNDSLKRLKTLNKIKIFKTILLFSKQLIIKINKDQKVDNLDISLIYI